MGYTEVQDRDQMQFISLEDMVEPDSMVRVIDRYIEVSPLENMGFEWAGGKTTGRPAYPMEGLAKLYVYGYAERIRSSRKLETETHRNVEVKWLTGNLTPDHKTIAEFRRKNIRPLQKLYRKFVLLCKDWDLVGGELVVVDGAKFKASNSRKLNFSRKKIAERLKRIDEQIEAYLTGMEKTDIEEDKLKNLKQRKEMYEGYMKSLDETGESELSAVDPDARMMGNNRGGVEAAYNVQSAVDGKHDIIIDYDVSLNPSDHGQLGSMVKNIKKHLSLKRFTVLADKGYYNGEDLARVKRYKVTAIVSRQKMSDPKDQDAAFHSDQFVYDKQSDSYTCPKGNILPRYRKNGVGQIKYCN
jgi:transposase